MSTNDFIIDSAVRHQIYVQRYAMGRTADVVSDFRSLARDIKAELIKAEKLTQAAKQTRKLREIQALINASVDELTKNLSDNFTDFAEHEASFAANALTAATTVEAVKPKLVLLKTAINSTKMVLAGSKTEQVISMPKAIKQFSNKKKQEIRSIIKNGWQQGKTVQQMTSDINRLVKYRTRNQAEALVRTSIGHISSVSRGLTHAANEDILEDEEWVATLDSRTTITCATLDGKLFKIGQGPSAPRHWNCRSLRVPRVKSEFSIIGKSGTRASFAGQVSAKRTYSGWLRDQSAAFQDSFLGSTRGKLYRAGGLSLDKFTDNSGVVYTLKELKLLDPIAFDIAI